MSTPTFQHVGAWVTSTEEFLRSVLLVRGCRWTEEATGRFQIEFPGEDAADWFEGKKQLRCYLNESGSGASASEGGESDGAEGVAADVDSKLFDWVTRRDQLPSAIDDAMSAERRGSVHELSQRLFAAYQVDPPLTMQLGGCAFEDRALLCLTYLFRPRETGADREAAVQLLRVFCEADGSQLDNDLVEELGVLEWAPADWRHARHRYAEGHWPQALQRGDEQFQNQHARDEGSYELVSATRVWSTYTEGRINLLAGDVTASIPFSGWARRLIRGHVAPPPFRCSHSGTESYHVGVTDDQKITNADEIAACTVSQKRVLASELETCERTGQRVHESLLATCPVTGRRLLETEQDTCQSCRQEVCPDALRGGRCLACRQLQSVEKSDPRLARILGEYPKLDEWHRWWISETQVAYILVARSWLRRHLIVLDKESLAPLHEATGSRFSRTWRADSL